jgi:hypothetical protein
MLDILAADEFLSLLRPSATAVSRLREPRGGGRRPDSVSRSTSRFCLAGQWSRRPVECQQLMLPGCPCSASTSGPPEKGRAC